MLFLRSQNIHDDLVDLTDSTFIDEKTDLEMKNSRVVFRDVLLNITGASIGRSAVYNSVLPANVNQHVCIIRLKDQRASQFLQTQLASNHGQDQVAMNQAGGGREGLNFKQISRFEFSFPTSTDEIGRIEALFQVLNQTIALHERKLELLKQLKKAYLQQLFTENGNQTPKLRFAGFTNDWKQRKVSELFRVTRGQVLAAGNTSSTKTGENPYPVYSSQTKNNGLMGYYSEYLFDTAITWTTDGANAGTVNFRSGKFYSTNVNGVLLSSVVKVDRALAESLNLTAWKWVSHVGNPKLMNNVMGEIPLSFSDDTEERQQISNLLFKLDKTIALHQRKLENLHRLKRAYLQKLFV